MQTLEIKDETVTRSKADKLLGVQKRSKLAFPVFNSLTQAIEAERNQPERRIALTQRFFKTYPVPEEYQKKWDRAPKVDSVVARLSRQTALPAEEAAFKDPLDRRMESVLKRSYTQAAAILRPAVASAGLARTAKHWAQELARHPPSSKQQLQTEVDKLSTTLSFLAEAATEITKLAAKATANTVVARRALWMRHWTGDTASKMKLLSLKFTGESLFGRSSLCTAPEQETQAQHCYPTTDNQETETDKHDDNPDSPGLAKQGLVHRPSQFVNYHTVEITTHTRSVDPRTDKTPQSSHASTNCVALETEWWKQYGLSQNAIDILLQARKQSTTKVYYRVWKTFLTWCGQRHIHWTDTSTTSVVEFVTDGFKKGLGLHTLKTQISALAALTHTKWADDPTIQQFIRGVTRAQMAITKSRLPSRNHIG
uniref:Lamina-associated polypeptide 2 alpha C-terminal domain-containing protein n=1 Tax=Xenopus tropicalis TaxID=8364 RepID=A0A1B8XUH8_XENTR